MGFPPLWTLPEDLLLVFVRHRTRKLIIPHATQPFPLGGPVASKSLRKLSLLSRKAGHYPIQQFFTCFSNLMLYLKIQLDLTNQGYPR